MVRQELRLLLIEDNPGDARLIRELLSESHRLEPQITVAGRLTDGLSNLADAAFDAILLDLSLPDSSGLDTLGRTLEAAPSTAIIVLTGLVDDETGLKAVHHGAADYFVKGQVNSDLLARAIVYAIERKRSEDELRRLSLAVEHSPSLTFITDAEGRIEYVNAKFHQWTGYTADEAIGQYPRILDPQEISPEEHAERWRRIRAGDEWRGEFLNRKKSGERYWEFASISPITDANGRARQIVIVKEDITQRKEAEKRIRYQANLLRNVSDAIVSTDLDFNIVSWNRAAERTYGWQAEEVVGQPFDIVAVSDRADNRFRRVLTDVIAAHHWEGEAVHNRQDGSVFHVHATVSLLWSEAGEAIGMVAIIRDITAFKESEEALRQSERRLTTLMSNLPGMAYRCYEDPWWTMEFISEGCLRLTGYSPEAMIQNHTIAYSHLIHEADRETVQRAIRTAVSEDRAFQLTYRIITADGTVKWVWEQGRSVETRDDGKVILEGFVTDITARRQAEQALKDRVQELDVLYEASRRLSRSLDLDELYGTLHDVIRQIADCDWLFISRYEPECRLIHCEYGFAEGQSIDVSQLPPLPLAPEGQGTQSTVIHTGQPIYFADYRAGLQSSNAVYKVRSDGALVDEKTAEGGQHPRSAFIIPLRYQGNVAGVVQIKSFKPDAYSESKRRILESLIHQAATALANARLFQQAQDELTERKQTEAALSRYATRLQALRNIDRAVLSAETPETIAHAALKHLQQIVSYRRLFVLAFDPVTFIGRVLAVDDKTDTPIASGSSIPPDDVLGFEGLRERQVMQIEDITQARDIPSTKTKYAEGLRALVNIPLVSQDRLVGMIGWRDDEPGALPDDHIEVLREVSDQLAVAIQQANLHQAEREQRRYSEALSTTAAAINSTLDLKDVLDTISANIEYVVPHDAAHIMLIESGIARSVSQRGFEKYGAQDIIAKFTPSIEALDFLSEMVKTQQTQVISNLSQHEGWRETVPMQWAQSYIGAPIRYNETVIGFLIIFSTTPNFYTEAHAKRLQGFADQAAISIRNAQLYQELEDYSGYLEQAVAERTAELQTSEAQYRAIVEDQTELIGRAWLDGTLTFVNAAYCRFFDKSQQQLIGLASQSLILKDDRAKWNEHFDRLSPEDPVITFEARACAADGDIRWMEWTGRLICDDFDTPVSVQFVGRDITQRKQAEDEMRRVLEREMEINEMRSRYLSMASHDLRTPLSVIQSNADMLKQYSTRLSEERKQQKLAQIQTTIKRMVELLDDILIIGRAEAGKLEFNPEPTELETFCHTILAELQTSIGTQHEIDFAVTGAGEMALLDPKLLRHMLYNLLSNAIKYSPEGSTVSLRLRFEPKQIVLTISDAGIGIPHENQKHLFSSFYRADNVGTIPGTGLGLAIVKQSVEMHGGEITFESTENVGTTFTIHLPLKDPLER